MNSHSSGFCKVAVFAGMSITSVIIFMMSDVTTMYENDEQKISHIPRSSKEGFRSHSERVLENGMLEIDVTIADGPVRPTWKSLGDHATRPTWWKDAKVGMWLHWGPQSVGREGDWYAKWIYMPKHAWKSYEHVYLNHVKRYGHPSEHGYKDILPLWRAERWDPDELMRLYKRAGARYVLAQVETCSSTLVILN